MVLQQLSDPSRPPTAYLIGHLHWADFAQKRFPAAEYALSFAEEMPEPRLNLSIQHLRSP